MKRLRRSKNEREKSACPKWRSLTLAGSLMRQILLVTSLELSSRTATRSKERLSKKITSRETMAEARGRNQDAAANCRKRVIALVQALPEARAVPAGDRHLSLEVRGKRFGWFLDDHHGDGRLALNLKAARGVNQTLPGNAPERFHVPKYIGGHGWLGVWLDSPTPNWSEIEKLITDAYYLTAPKQLAKLPQAKPTSHHLERSRRI
jgi:hypothetical protein